MRIEDKHILVRVVANLEILWTPFRFPPRDGSRALAGVRERRQRYRAGHGVELVVGGETADRQRGFQALRRLQSAGLIGLHKSGVHRTGVSLERVDAGLSITPNCRLVDSWPILLHLDSLHGDPDVLRNGADFILESCVVDAADGNKVAEFESRAWPLLLLGHLETATDATGCIGWRITDTGRAAMAAGPPEPDDLSGEYLEKLGTEYNRLVAAGLGDRPGWLPESSHELAIPLSAGSWGTIKQHADATLRAKAAREPGAGDG